MYVETVRLEVSVLYGTSLEPLFPGLFSVLIEYYDPKVDLQRTHKYVRGVNENKPDGDYIWRSVSWRDCVTKFYL